MSCMLWPISVKVSCQILVLIKIRKQSSLVTVGSQLGQLIFSWHLSHLTADRHTCAQCLVLCIRFHVGGGLSIYEDQWNYLVNPAKVKAKS